MAYDIRNLIMLSPTKALDITTNLLVDLQSEDVRVVDNKVSLNSTVEIVHGQDGQVIQLNLSGEDGVSQVKNGFLIEVFEQNPDGTLTKLEQETISDLNGDNVLVEGYSDFLTILADV